MTALVVFSPEENCVLSSLRTNHEMSNLTFNADSPMLTISCLDATVVEQCMPWNLAMCWEPHQAVGGTPYGADQTIVLCKKFCSAKEGLNARGSTGATEIVVLQHNSGRGCHDVQTELVSMLGDYPVAKTEYSRTNNVLYNCLIELVDKIGTGEFQDSAKSALRIFRNATVGDLKVEIINRYNWQSFISAKRWAGNMNIQVPNNLSSIAKNDLAAQLKSAKIQNAVIDLLDRIQTHPGVWW